MWLQTFREEMGLSLDQLGAAIRKLGAQERPPLGCSDELLHRLEVDRNFRTVPAIANLIASACGATAEQRDRLVLKHYRGQWTPTGEAKIRIGKEEAPQTIPQPGFKPVYAIDTSGNVVRRYESVTQAAEHFGVRRGTIYNRCRGNIEGDEFATLGFTFRYADTWEAMSRERRRLDALRARLTPTRPLPPETSYAKDQRKSPGTGRPVVVIDLQGREHRYSAMAYAHLATGISDKVIREWVRRDRMEWPYCMNRYAIIYAEIWDAMSAEERRAWLERE